MTRRIIPSLLAAVVLLAAFSPPAVAGSSLVVIAPPLERARLAELERRGVMVIYASDQLAFGIAADEVCARLAPEVRPLGAADDGLEHYLLSARTELAALPGGVRTLGRFGDEVLVAIPPGAIEALLGDFAPVRLFHRPLRLVAPPVPAPSAPLTPDPTIQALVASITQSGYQAIHQDVYGNDGMGNRYATSSGGANAQSKIQGLFLSYGFTDVSLFNVPGFPTKNVVCKLPGTTTPDVVYVIGGHYDTVSNTQGADDNASGTTGVLTVARAIGQAYQAGVRFDSTIVFIAFTAEEWGLYGSDAYASWASGQGMDIRGMLNMDMIGYVDPGDAVDMDTIANSLAGSLALQAMVPQVITDYVPGFATVSSNGSSVANQSDHYSFWQQGYPAVFLFEDGYDYCPYIHSPQDTIGQGLNDYGFAHHNTQVAAALLATLAGAVAGATPPVADFSATPLTGAAPLDVAFTDLSTGTVSAWSWMFGDGATSPLPSPNHVYSSAGSYDVCLTATGPGGSDQLCRAAYIDVTSAGTTLPFEIAAMPGPGPTNVPEARVWNASAAQQATFLPFATAGYGGDIASGSFDGDVEGEHVTGPGPNPVFGPQVRGFEALGTPVVKVSFYAYGTLRFGVNVALGDLDGDDIGEIATGAGPGAVFGPHVRAFDFDGGPLAVLPGASFFAYQTLKYGVNPALGTIDASGRAAIVTGPGPGTVFGAQVRGFEYAASHVTALAKVNFVAFQGYAWGATVATGDLDADDLAEIVAGPGPAPLHARRVAGFDYDGAAIAPIFDQTLAATTHGTRLASGNLDADTAWELLASPGPDPASPSSITGWKLSAGTLVAMPSVDFQPYGGQPYGARLASFDLGSY